MDRLLIGGIILNPVLGWTNHHSIVKFKKSGIYFFMTVQCLGENSFKIS